MKEAALCMMLVSSAQDMWERGGNTFQHTPCDFYTCFWSEDTSTNSQGLHYADGIHFVSLFWFKVDAYCVYHNPSISCDK